MEKIENDIAILLATFNGEKYLDKLLDSLLSQSYQNFTVYIRDDGSDDNTLQIINDYCRNNKGKFFVIDDPIKHKGAAKSFMWLLTSIDAKYYMFCDQDDIWLNRKVEITYNKMKETEQLSLNLPIIIHTDLMVVDMNLNTIHPSYFKAYGLERTMNKSYGWKIRNGITGCTVMINNKVKSISIPYPEYALMHDSWISVTTRLNNGVVRYIDQATILYRQHGNNAVGFHIKKRIEKILTIREMFKETTEWYHFIHQAGHISIYKFVYYKCCYYCNKLIPN